MTVDHFVVDADQHVNPPPTFWAEYLPSDLRDLAPLLEHGDDGNDYVVFEGKRKQVNLIGAQAGRKADEFKFDGRLADARNGGWMAPARLDDMDLDHIGGAVIFGGGPIGTTNPALYRASFDAYNRWVADFCSYEPKRLSGIAYVPMQDVDESIRLVRDAHSRGLRGVNIPAFPQSNDPSAAMERMTGAQLLALTGDPTGPRQYGDAEFDPFWAVCCDLGMPVTIHLGTRGNRMVPEHFLTDLLMSKMTMAEPISVLIHGKVFERFPELKFCVVECGVGWFAFAAQYMDTTWERQRHWLGSTLANPPSFYWDQNVYGVFLDDEVGVSLRKWPGAKNIMWASDYPHSETTFPNSVDAIERNFRGVPEDEMRWMTSGLAAKVFGF